MTRLAAGEGARAPSVNVLRVSNDLLARTTRKIHRFSNCMSCHGVATVAATGSNINSLPYPPNYAKPISFGEGSVPIDPRFAGFTRTDFSWAIPVNAK